ncbi:MAG: DUF4320 family protein [Lachnospiraceae bacterium]|nr:DUF4320 family protein [Lachnospiraceae bacterium]
MKFLKEKRGDIFSVETLLSLLIMFLGFSSLLIILPYFHHQQKLDSFARELVRSCEVDGSVSQASYISYLKQRLSINPEVTFEYHGLNSSKKVQLNDEIKVIARDNFKIQNKFISINIPMVSVATGKSEIYYKSD